MRWHITLEPRTAPGIKGRAVVDRGIVSCAIGDQCSAIELCCVLPSADCDLGIVLATTPIAISGKSVPLHWEWGPHGPVFLVRGLESLWGCCVLPPLQDCSASAVFVGLWDSCALGVLDLAAHRRETFGVPPL